MEDSIVDILADLQTLINEHGSASIMKERLVLISEQIEKIQNENKDLKDKNMILEREKEELSLKVEALLKWEKFTEVKGALFKKNPNGGFYDVVYCPKCQISTASKDNGYAPFVCSQCGWGSSFDGRLLHQVMRGLS